MHKNITRLAVVGVAAVTAAGVAGIAAGATAPKSAPSVAAPSAPSHTLPPTANRPQVEHEAGIVMEGTGEVGGMTFMVTVYENSRYGNSIQVVLGDPDDNRIGYVEQAEPFVVDGVLDASVTVRGKVVRLHGTVAPTGQPENVTEAQTDAGQRIIVKGTHRALATDVVLSYQGASGAVSFAPAFAYDLQTRKITLYGR